MLAVLLALFGELLNNTHSPDARSLAIHGAIKRLDGRVAGEEAEKIARALIIECRRPQLIDEMF